MVVDQKSQAKELLARSSVRTMKKDLKKLRETDVVKESEKIVNLAATTDEAQKQKTFILEKQKVELKHELQSVVAEKKPIAPQQSKLEQEQKRAQAATLSEREVLDSKLKDLQQKQQSVQEKEAVLKTKLAQTESSLEKIHITPPAAPKPAAPVALPKPQNSEEVQKRKFMEDVEAWVNSNK